MESLEAQAQRIEELRRDLSATISSESFCPPFQYPSDGCMSLDSHIEPDLEKRDKAELELQRIYNSSTERSLRYMAGKALGYSKRKIWTQEDPIRATIVGVVGSGLVASFAYALYQYFTK
jgi:hypothetical protein